MIRRYLLVEYLLLTVLQKLCKTIDSKQALREAEEREQETSVNDEDMADRLRC